MALGQQEEGQVYVRKGGKVKWGQVGGQREYRAVSERRAVARYLPSQGQCLSATPFCPRNVTQIPKQSSLRNRDFIMWLTRCIGLELLLDRVEDRELGLDVVVPYVGDDVVDVFYRPATRHGGVVVRPFMLLSRTEGEGEVHIH